MRHTISHLEKVRFQGHDALVLARGTNAEGLQLFFYMKCDREQYTRLCTAYEGLKKIRPSEYGDVIYLSENEPDEYVRQWILKKAFAA